MSEENYLDTTLGEPSVEEITAVTEAIRQDIESNTSPPLNRAQRRALMKKAGKQGRNTLDLISETAKKLDYISLIQKVRELNKKREQENDSVEE